MASSNAVELGFSTPLGEIVNPSEEEMRAEFADYADLGAEWIRTNFWWDIAQREPNGDYNWSLMDSVVDTASEYGIKVIGEFNGAPSWIDKSFSSAEDREAFRDYAVAAVEHFEGRVDHWEVWNEQNMKNIAPEDYADLLQTAYPAIKDADSSATVITGGLAATPRTGDGLVGAVDYLERMYDAGAKGNFDAVGFHPYTYPLLPEDDASYNGWQIMEDGIRDTMVENGDAGLDVWMTELGAPTDGGGAVSQEVQAEIVEQAVDLASDLDWAGPIMWYSYQDRGGSTGNKENWFGLLGPNGEKKDAYDAYRAAASGEGFAPDGEAAAGVVEGTAGNDWLSGTDGEDIFVPNLGWDVISGFGDGDRIDLSNLDADTTLTGIQDFSFINDEWLSEPGDLGSYRDERGWTSVQGYTDDEGGHDFNIKINGIHHLTEADFIL